MRSLLCSSLAYFAVFALLAPAVQAQCAATPEAAAKEAIGMTVSSAADARNGYRVQDVQIDPVLHRAWVRVRSCADAAAPLMLIPIGAPAGAARPATLVATAAMPEQTKVTAYSAVPPALISHPAQQPAVRAGDNVTVVFASTAVHMELEGTATGQAHIGEQIEVLLKRRPGQTADEPTQRFRGTLLAENRVEVQP